MGASDVKEITIEKAFSKGLVEGKGRDNIPNYFSGYIRNARIVNGSMTVRKGQTEYTLGFVCPGPVQGIVFTDQAYFVSGGNFCSLGGIIGPIGYFGIVDFITYGQVIIILTGVGNPRVYSPPTGLFQVSNSNMPLDPTLNIFINPVIGASFTGFTVIAGNIPGYTNVMYVSKPVFVDSTGGSSVNQPQIQNSYDWSLVTGIGSNKGESRIMTSDILAMEANNNNLYVFCRKTIEILGRSNVTNVGGIVTLFTQPIGDGDEVINSRIVVPAGEKIFYLTTSGRVKTIGFVPGVTDPMIGDLTDRVYQTVTGFFDRLDPDQSKAFGVYCKNDNTVRRHMKTTGALNNDICLLYDIVNDTFLVDDNKQYIGIAPGVVNNIYRSFALSGTVTASVFYDDLGYFDSTLQPPPFERDSPNIGFGVPTKPKQFRGTTIGGGINQGTTLNFSWYVDGNIVFTRTLSYADVSDPALVDTGGPSQLGNPLALYPFQWVADEGEIREKGKMIRLKITIDPVSTTPDFYLDFLSFLVRPIGRYDLPDKI